ncbi:MAG: autotransporter outer membrane beta-barrel domain-containing protein [Pseudomonadales bacterium]|nr:autotransporter outer membrane beta-barrel domain-containing protein [Pseudomonadales bacterium]
MLKLSRLLALVFMGLCWISSAQAVIVNDYTATTFTTVANNIRVIDILDITAAVQYESGESASGASLSLFCIDQSCSEGELELFIADAGRVYIDGNNQIVFEPEDPEFEGSFQIEYRVAISTTEDIDDGVLTVLISNSLPTAGRKNIETIATVIDGYCSNPVNETITFACQQYESLSAEEKVDALSTISPEEVVAEFTSTVNMTKDQTSNLANRLSALRGGATGISVAGLNYHQGDDILYGQWLHEMANQVGGNASADQNFTPFGFFINGSITDGDKDTTSLEQGYDLEGDSITLGMDYRFNEAIVAGVAYGISDTEISFETSGNDMSNEIDNLLVYGSWYKDSFYIDALFGYASGDITTKRTISVGSINETVGGETESSQIFFSVTGNYDFVKNAWTYGPYASLDYIDGDIEGYEEIGTTGFEVGFDDQDIESQIVTLGGRIQYAWSQPWGIIVPHARVEWKSELEDERTAIVGRFILDTSGDSFTIEADNLDSSWFQMGVGVSATFQHGLSAYLDYEEVISYDDTSLSTLSFGGRWEAKF